MKLSELKEHLQGLEGIRFRLPDGNYVPAHFHITEIGKVNRDFIDCGGTRRKEQVINFQLFYATDYQHRLGPQKLSDIINLSEEALELEDAEIEIEYQSSTIGKYQLEFDGKDFVLQNMQTNCLDREKCGIPPEKPKIKLSTLTKVQNDCTPGSGCC